MLLLIPPLRSPPTSPLPTHVSNAPHHLPLPFLICRYMDSGGAWVKLEGLPAIKASVCSLHERARGLPPSSGDS